METFTMSRKEAPRPGLLRAARAGQISNRQGALGLPDGAALPAAQAAAERRGRGGPGASGPGAALARAGRWRWPAGEPVHPDHVRRLQRLRGSDPRTFHVATAVD